MSKRLALALFVAAMPACSSDPPPVTGSLLGMPFVARGGFFETTTQNAGGVIQTETDMHLFDYNYCATIGSPIQHAPAQVMEVDIFFNVPQPTRTDDFDGAVTAPGQFTLDPDDAGPSAGLDAPAEASMVVDDDGSAFTGGTVTVDTVSTDELTGSLVMTTGDGDYVQGNFRVTDCAGP